MGKSTKALPAIRLNQLQVPSSKTECASLLDNAFRVDYPLVGKAGSWRRKRLSLARRGRCFRAGELRCGPPILFSTVHSWIFLSPGSLPSGPEATVETWVGFMSLQSQLQGQTGVPKAQNVPKGPTERTHAHRFHVHLLSLMVKYVAVFKNVPYVNAKQGTILWMDDNPAPL